MLTMLPTRRWGVPAILAALLLRPLQLVAAQPPQVAQEYDLKAAFLFNLAKFVRWPGTKFDQPDSPLVIGVRGGDALERFSRVLQGKTIDKHKISVRPLERIEDAGPCQVVFISRSEQGRLGEWVQAAKNATALTVGETPDFLDQGGMIQFSIESEQLRLEIDERCVRKAGIDITASALSTLINKGIAKVRKS